MDEVRGSVRFRTDFGECFGRLTPTAKYNVSAMLPKYVAVKGNRSWEIRWRTGGSDQHSSYFGSTLIESAARLQLREQDMPLDGGREVARSGLARHD